VRGAIDCVLVATGLAQLRGVASRGDEGYGALLLDAMIVALSGRIHLDDAAQSTPEQVLRVIWEEHLLLRAGRGAGLRAVPLDSIVSRRTHNQLRGGLRRPLDRKPKQLSTEPALFKLAHGPRGVVLVGGRPGSAAAEAGGSPAPGATGEHAELDGQPPSPPPGPRDPEAYRIARQIAKKPVDPQAGPARAERAAGDGRACQPCRTAADPTTWTWTGQSTCSLSDRCRMTPNIIVRERTRTRRCVVLAVDVSGSMRGERIRNAAAAVGALAAELRDDPAGRDRVLVRCRRHAQARGPRQAAQSAG